MVLLEKQNLQIANQMQVAQDSISGSIKKRNVAMTSIGLE